MLVKYAHATLGRAFFIILGAAGVVGILAVLLGWGGGIEHSLETSRLRHTQEQASGEIVVVAIDARSLVEVQAWPWPRSVHGQLVDRLNEAGARQIVFDIDFTSPARDPEQDLLFGEAIERAGGKVVLPAVLENANGDFGERLELLPSEPLARHAKIGSIWITLDSDMAVRHVPHSVEIAGARRPSLAAYLADQPSQRSDSIIIDWSLDHYTIPSISYADVLAGRFDPAFFRDRNVLIGGTSLTLGDRFDVPHHGRIPGLYIQAAAAETLRRHDPVAVGPWPALLVALALIAAWLACRRGYARASLILGTGVLLAGAPLVLREYTPLVVNCGPAIFAFLAATLLQGFAAGSGAVVARLTRTPGTNLPNLAAMQLAGGEGVMMVVRLRNHVEATALLGAEAHAELLRKVCDRLSLAASGSGVFQVDDHSFAWLYPGSAEEAAEAVQALQALFSSGIAIGERAVDVTISVGLCDEEGLDLEAAAAAAMLAADQAAQRGLAWERYQPNLNDSEWRLSLLGELDRAIDRGDVWNAYQPQYSLTQQAITGAEALVRWSHSERGEIQPDLFIPILEENGRVEKLTLHVLRHAIQDFAELDERLNVSVNISMRMIGKNRLVGPLREMLCEYRMDPARLTLEITESAAIAEAAGLEELQRLRDVGINLSIDDYGTGQSTLSYLRTLPACELKIDRSFVQAIAHNRSDATMVDSTVKLAHALGMKVVAEGVETEEVARILRGMECDFIQGFHVGRPGTLEEFVTRVSGPRQGRSPEQAEAAPESARWRARARR